MDKLSIFSNSSTSTEVSLTSTENNTLDTVVGGLADIKRELQLTRKGNEAFVYGEEVEESDEVDMEGIAEEEQDE